MIGSVAMIEEGGAVGIDLRQIENVVEVPAGRPLGEDIHKIADRGIETKVLGGDLRLTSVIELGMVGLTTVSIDLHHGEIR